MCPDLYNQSIDLSNSSTALRDFTRVFKVGSTYYARDSDGTLISSSTTAPETVIQAAIDSGNSTIFIDDSTYIFSAGFTGLNITTGHITLQMGDGTTLQVPQNYTGYCIKLEGSILGTRITGGKMDEAGTPAKLWKGLYIKSTGASAAIKHCKFDHIQIDHAGWMVYLECTVSGAFINSNEFTNIFGYYPVVGFEWVDFAGNDGFLHNNYNYIDIQADITTLYGFKNAMSRTPQFVGCHVQDMDAAATQMLIHSSSVDCVILGGSINSGGTSGLFTDNGLNTIIIARGQGINVGDDRLRIRNPTDTFKYTITAAAIAADRILNLPLTTATDTLASLGLAQIFSLGQTFTKSIIANGGFNLQKVTKTSGDSPYTASSDDSVILYDASGGNSTINLPAAASNTGKQYKIVRTDILSSTTSLTIDANSTETIDGVLTWILRPAEKIEIVSDGSNWIVTWHNNPSYSGYYYMKNSTNNRRYPAGYNPNNESGQTSTTSPAANTLWALPLVIDKVTKFDLISFEITTLEAAKNARAGIYKDNGNMYPGALIFDTGNVSVGSTGLKDTTITSGLQVFQPGLYWLTWETDSTTCQIRGMTASSPVTYSPFGLSNSWGTRQGYGYSVAHTFGALPDPYTGSATILTTTPAVGAPVPLIALRAI